MTIREVEHVLGTTRANVRFYEKEGLLFPKRNPLNDYRDYSPEDMETLKRILYLRSLGIPVETIRRLIQQKADMRDILTERLAELGTQKKQMAETEAACEKLLLEPVLSFRDFPMEQVELPERKNNIKDALTELWFFWDRLVVWGFLAIQAFYTFIVFLFLPREIPTAWDGVHAVEYGGRGRFFLYLLISIIMMYAVRQLFYVWLMGGLRCYMDELNAIATVGVIGYWFSRQVYTVLYLQGFSVSIDVFQLGCVLFYLAVIFLIVLFYRKYKKAQ